MSANATQQIVNKAWSAAQVPLLMVVHPGVPATNVREFIALAKASPGRINYSSAGHGSTGHLTGELLKTRAGIDIVHVNYKGGGQIQMLITAPPRRPSLHPRATPGAPDIPTLAESGYPGLEVASWYGILAPAGTPQDIVRKLNADINRILKSPDVLERLTALGTEPTGGTAEQFAETIKADTAKWAKVVGDAGIRID
jgi:tripartite-type tricarboxylate transporter receptor subunit TctC